MTARQDLEKAYKLYKDDKLEEAETICKDVADNNPKYSKAFQLLSQIYNRKGEILTAEKYIKQALSLAPDDAECLNSYGNIFKKMRQLQKAKEKYNESLKIAPGYLAATQNLGELYLKEKNPLKAADIFSQGLVHNPDHPILQRGLLYALKDSHQTDAAMQLLDTMPPSPDLQFTAGQLMSEAGYIVEAKSAFLQGMAHPQTAIMAYKNLVQFTWMQEGLENAGKVIAGLISQNPETEFLQTTGAALFHGMGDTESAKNLLGQYEKKFGPHFHTHALHAQFAMEHDDGQSAFEHAEAGLKLNPGNPELMSLYAKSALMTERYDTVLEAASQVLKFQPDHQFWLAVLATAQRGLNKNYHTLYDYKKFVKSYIIEAPPEYDDQTAFLSELKTTLINMHEFRHHPIGQSLIGGTQTSPDLRFSESHVIQDFFQALSDPIHDYLNQIGHEKDHPLTRRNVGNYRLAGAWSVWLRGEGFHVNHVHPEGWISSSFYVDVPNDTHNNPDKKGWIKFGEPPVKVPGMDAEHFIGPKAGQLVLFPSYMWHGTIAIDPDASRLTLPFDALPT